MAKVEIEGEPLIVLRLTIPEAKALMGYLQNPLIKPKDAQESKRALDEELPGASEVRQSIFSSLFGIIRKVEARGFPPIRLKSSP